MDENDIYPDRRYDAPPLERLENVRAECDQAQRLAITLAGQLDEVRAAFAADLARAEAEHERLASVIRAMVKHLDRWGGQLDEQADALVAALTETGD